MHNATAEDGENPNALSLFGQAANANDFPVLKAFQEYIDAEQAKARKRMLGLSIFFVVLLVAVVVTFTVVVMSIVSHNRELSDRLLDVAFRERQAPVVVTPAAAPQPIVQPQPTVAPAVAPAQDSGIKPILEKLEALAAAMVARQQQALQLQQPAPVVVTAAPAPVAPSAPVETVESKQMRETIKRQQAELEAERNRLKEAEEKLRKAEIERHRRRLYPEYYAQQDAAPSVSDRRKTEVPPRTAGPVATPLGNLKPINYFAQDEDDEDLAELSRLTKKPSERAQPVRPALPAAKPKPRDSKKPAAASTAAAPSVQPGTPAPAPKKEGASATKPTSPSVSPTSSVKKAQVPSAKAEQPPVSAKQPEAKKKIAPPPVAIRTETLDVGTSSDNSIPWLIEERDL